VNVDFVEPPGDALWPLFVMGVTVCVILTFETFLRAPFWRHRGRDELGAILAQRLGGAALLGLLPGLLLVVTGRALEGYGLGWGQWSAGVPLFVVTVVALPLIFAQSRSRSTWAHYPELRLAVWTPRTRALNVASWAIYLVAYELLFRGFLLFSLALWIGPWPAVGVMTAMYVLAHLGKAPGEAYGCIPMGLLFGWTALVAGSIWPGVAAHIAIAVFNDWAVIRHDPARRMGPG